jgi:hypothetical protein
MECSPGAMTPTWSGRPTATATDERWDTDMDGSTGAPPPEQAIEDDPIPDVFPEQDPGVDREWEEAKDDPMGGQSPSS